MLTLSDDGFFTSRFGKNVYEEILLRKTFLYMWEITGVETFTQIWL